MSSETNIKLLERASELIDETTSHPAGLDKQLIEAVDSGDLEQVQYWVTVTEGTLAQEYYESVNGMPFDLDKNDFDWPEQENE